mmetsp:Transcript_128970/g.413068  ORF Transcript_128970/g.413068 Transcript_128970/m.413068 type:complete len:283 (-) Transcript_128970:2563-3411(-)
MSSNAFKRLKTSSSTPRMLSCTSSSRSASCAPCASVASFASRTAFSKWSWASCKAWEICPLCSCNLSDKPSMSCFRPSARSPAEAACIPRAADKSSKRLPNTSSEASADVLNSFHISSVDAVVASILPSKPWSPVWICACSSARPLAPSVFVSSTFCSRASTVLLTAASVDAAATASFALNAANSLSKRTPSSPSRRSDSAEMRVALSCKSVASLLQSVSSRAISADTWASTSRSSRMASSNCFRASWWFVNIWASTCCLCVAMASSCRVRTSSRRLVVSSS